MVLYGAASGQPPPVEIAKLNARSLFLTRPTLAHYGASGDELRMRAGDCSAGSRRASSTCGSAAATRSRTPRARRPTSRRARTTGKLILTP